MSTVARLTLPLSLLLVLFGCKENTVSNNEDNDFIAQTIGAEGGDLDLDGVASLHIPADALAEDVEVRLGRVSSSYPPFPSGPMPLGGIFMIEPRELAFQTAATISMKGSQGTLWLADSQSWTMLDTQAGGGRLSADTLVAGFFTALDSGGGKVTDAGMMMGGGGTVGDGMLSRSGIPGNTRFMAVGDSYVFYPQSGTDQFGAMSNLLVAAPLDSMDAPVTIADFGDKGGGTMGIAVVGDSVFWIQDNMGLQPPSSELYRAGPGVAPEMLAQVSQGMGGFAAAGGTVMFVNQARQLQLYDATAGSLDATLYGEPASNVGPFGGSTFTKSEDHVFFLMGGQDSPYQVWASTFGAPGANTGITFPGAASIVALGGTGSTFVLVTFAGTQCNVLTYDTTTPGAQPVTIANFAAEASGPGSGNVVIDGDELFATTFAQGSSLGDVIKISIADGTQTKLGTYVAAGGARPISVNANGVYVVQPSMTADGELHRWAR